MDFKKKKKKKSQQWLHENKWSMLLKFSNNNILHLQFTSSHFYYSESSKSFYAYADDSNYSKPKTEGFGVFPPPHENIHFID